MSASALDESLAPERQARTPGVLTIGNKAFYPGQGPCRIGRIITRVVDAKPVMFYHLSVLDDNRGDLFVPVEKARAIGLRLLMKKTEIPKLLVHLKKTATTADNWKQRATDNLKLFGSGSPYDLAEVVASLTRLGASRSLTLGESVTLGRARKLLICEISEVTGETRPVVEEQIDCVLERNRTKESPVSQSE